MPSRTIRASEIGAFLYCKKAWWHARQGVQSENQAELLGGSELHRHHGQAVLTSSYMRWLAYSLLFLGLAVLTFYFTGQIF